MTASVNPVANAGDGPAARLVAFAVRLRRRHVRAAAEGTALRAVLALAVPAVAAAWLLPAHRTPIAVGFAGAIAAAAAVAALRARRTADAALLAGDAGAVAAVGDGLATFLEHRARRRNDPPMLAWLGRDVERRLPAIAPRALATAGRRRLGRWRRLVPLVLLAVLVWLVAEWLRPPWPGVAGGGSREGTGSAAGGSGQGDGAGDAPTGAGDPAPAQPAEGGTPPEPEDQPAPDEPPAPEPPPRDAPPPPRAESGAPGEAAEPAPLLDLPPQQRFVVPEFIGDGPTRRVRMHAAELAQRGGAPRPAARESAGGAGEDPAVPPPTAATFERAAEAAARARHVPDEERPMVRRFFALLREAAK